MKGNTMLEFLLPHGMEISGFLQAMIWAMMGGLADLMYRPALLTPNRAISRMFISAFAGGSVWLFLLNWQSLAFSLRVFICGIVGFTASKSLKKMSDVVDDIIFRNKKEDSDDDDTTTT
jgi:hypothetical protein